MRRATVVVGLMLLALPVNASAKQVPVRSDSDAAKQADADQPKQLLQLLPATIPAGDVPPGHDYAYDRRFLLADRTIYLKPSSTTRYYCYDNSPFKYVCDAATADADNIDPQPMPTEEESKCGRFGTELPLFGLLGLLAVGGARRRRAAATA